MPTDSDLVDLLQVIGDRAPDPDHTLDVLSPQLRPAGPGRTHRGRHVLAVAAAALAVAGIAVGSAVVLHAGGTANTAAGYADAEPTTNHETYELPLDRYHASDTQLRLMQRAQDVLVDRCSRAQGVSPARLQRVPPGDEARAFLSGIANDIRPLTLEQARAFGYELYPGGLGPRDGIRTGELTRAQLRVSETCGEQASRTLLHGARPVVTPGQPLEGQYYLFEDDLHVQDVFVAEARAHSMTPAVRHAQTRWSACMADHGYPGLASTSQAIDRQSGSASAAARRQAEQDVRCKEATGFMTVWVGALRDAQEAVIAKHRTALAGFERRLKIRLANAERVLS